MTTSIRRVDLDEARPSLADWRLAPGADTPAQPMVIEGRYGSARRCIDAPCLDVTPVDGAEAYEILVAPSDAPRTVWSLRGPRPRIDLAAIWQDLPYGSLQVQPRAWDHQARLIGHGQISSIVRSPDWHDQAVAPLDYRATGQAVINYLVNTVTDAPEHPGDPAYMWHAAVDFAGPPNYHPFQFPALVYPSLINLFLTGAARGLDAATGSDLHQRARHFCDFLISHPAITTGPLAGVPFSTMNQQGTGGMHEADRITLLRLAWVGSGALRLAEATGERGYAAYAERLAAILLTFQQPSGGWPYRVRLTDGDIVEPYTGAVIMVMLLLEQLATRDPAGPYADAVDQGMEWILHNPVQTGLWQQMYEDVATREPYTNLEQWAALETAIFVLRRRHPGATDLACQLVRYVEDQFVIFGDDPVTPVSYRPYTPCNLEQYGCYWPMDFHTASYARAALALYQSTGDGIWARKAIAAANTIVHCLQPDGHLSTAVPDQRLGVAPGATVNDWFNCMAHAADVLLTIGPTLSGLARGEERG